MPTQGIAPAIVSIIQGLLTYLTVGRILSPFTSITINLIWVKAICRPDATLGEEHYPHHPSAYGELPLLPQSLVMARRKFHMHHHTRNRYYLVLAALLCLPVPATAMPTITCHCFTDRSYDAARPAAADPYFLATTQNSFFAAAFRVDKKSIVINKQKGVSADDLWVAYWLAARSGANPESLLNERTTTGSWRQVATSAAVPVKSLGVRVADTLKSNATDQRLAEAVVDELLLRFRFYGAPELADLRRASAGNQELILAGLVAAKTRQPATQLYRSVRGGKTSWGALLQQAKIDPAEIQAEVMALVRSPRTK